MFSCPVASLLQILFRTLYPVILCCWSFAVGLILYILSCTPVPLILPNQNCPMHFILYILFYKSCPVIERACTIPTCLHLPHLLGLTPSSGRLHESYDRELANRGLQFHAYERFFGLRLEVAGCSKYSVLWGEPGVLWAVVDAGGFQAFQSESISCRAILWEKRLCLGRKMSCSRLDEDLRRRLTMPCRKW